MGTKKKKFMEKLLILVLVCLVPFVLNTCVGGTDPVENNDLATCCWYSDNTCCTADFNPIIQQLSDTVDEIYSLMDAGNEDAHENQKCVAYIDSYLCFMCSPNTSKFMSLDGVITFCSDFCSGFYDACSFLLEQVPDGPTSSKELCGMLASGDDGGFNITVNVASSNCYGGSDVSTIAHSKCTPWEGDYSSSDNSSDVSTIAHSKCTPWEGDYSSSDNSYLFLLFLIGFGVIAVCVVVIALGAGISFFIYRKRKFQKNYPNQP